MTKREIRTDIQFLRFVAVFMVTLYHFWPGRLTGGFAGVDVFFVISGFLITGGLVRSLESDAGLNVLKFWSGRVRRLIPAALLVAVASFFAVFLLVQPELRVSSISHFVPSFLYFENIQLQLDSTDYFADTNPSVYQHYWSLSVEEQFYIFWPIALIVIGLISKSFGKLKRNLMVVVGATTLASFSYGVYLTFTNPDASYFDSFSRAWEFGAGALLSIIQPKFNRRFPQVFAGAGLLLIAACSLLLTSNNDFPGFFALVPVLGTLLVISAKGSNGPIFSTMSWRPFQFLGDISYSLYLWHWPIVVLLTYWLGSRPSNFLLVCALLGAILLAWLTKTFVEDPIRFLKHRNFNKPAGTFLAMGVSVALVGAVAISGAAVNVSEIKANAEQLVRDQASNSKYCLGAESMANFGRDCQPVPADLRIPSDYRQISQITPGEIWTTRCRTNIAEKLVRKCVFGDKTSTTELALVGDSHAASWFPAIKKIAELNHWKLTTYYKSGCTLAVGQRSDLKPGKAASCQWWEKTVLDELKHSSIDIVVVGYARASLNIRSEGGETLTESATRGLSDMMSSLLNSGKSVVAIRDNPIPGKSLAPCLMNHQSNPHECDLPRSKTVKLPDPMELAAEAHPEVILADFTNYLCGPEICPAFIGGMYPYLDDDHLVRTFVMTLLPVWKDLLTRATILSRATNN